MTTSLARITPAYHDDGATDFPLDLTPFELLMIRDDRHAYPMVAEIRLMLSGNVDRCAMEAAVQNAAIRHPLLNARLENRRDRRPRWSAGKHPTIVEWGTSTECTDRDVTHIDLSTESGLLVIADVNQDKLQLRIRVHHANCDGIGVFVFLEDVLAEYANATSDLPRIELRRIDQTALKRRGRLEWNSRNMLQRIRHFAFGARQTWKFATRKPVTIHATANESRGDRSSNVARTHCRESSGLLSRLRRTAAKNNVTLNDLLLRDWFLAIRKWNTRHDNRGANALLRLLMPCNLREDKHHELSAANVMGYSFLSRTTNDCDDHDELLRGISLETEFIRTRRASLIFIRTLEAANALPMGQYLMPTSDRCLATALLSNIGDPTMAFDAAFPRHNGRLVVGNLVLDEIEAYSPIRPQTRAGIVVNTYANQLSIGMTYDRSALPSSAASSLLGMLRSQLELSAFAN